MLEECFIPSLLDCSSSGLEPKPKNPEKREAALELLKLVTCWSLLFGTECSQSSFTDPGIAIRNQRSIEMVFHRCDLSWQISSSSVLCVCDCDRVFICAVSI